MQGVTYLTKNRVKPDHFGFVAEQLGFRATVDIRDEKGFIHIDYSQGEKGGWECNEHLGENGEFEVFLDDSPETIAMIKNYNPVSVYIIAYPISSWEVLTVFLKELLKIYDGWIGYDCPNFMLRVNLNNIDELPPALKVYMDLEILEELELNWIEKMVFTATSK